MERADGNDGGIFARSVIFASGFRLFNLTTSRSSFAQRGSLDGRSGIWLNSGIGGGLSAHRCRLERIDEASQKPGLVDVTRLHTSGSGVQRSHGSAFDGGRRACIGNGFSSSACTCIGLLSIAEVVKMINHE